MKTTGIVRNLEDLGRVVIPIELRRVMGIDIKDPLEIFVEEEHILLKKYEPTCIMCGEGNKLIQFKGKNLCRKCIKFLKHYED